MIKKKIIIKGSKVQNVGYRLFLLNIADSEFLPYFDANNREDLDEAGNEIVEVLVGGEKEQVDNFIDFINIKNNRPKKAKVESIEVVDEDYKRNIRITESFSRWLSNSQLYKMVDIGSAMLEKQYAMVEKQDKTIETMDTMVEKQVRTIETMDTMVEKQVRTIETMDTMVEKQVKTIETMDTMVEKQDKTIETMDTMVEKQDKTIETMDTMVEKQVKTIETIKGLRAETSENFGKLDNNLEKLRTETSENFGKLEIRYKLISEGMFAIIRELKETNETLAEKLESAEKEFGSRIEKTEKNIERLLEILVEEKKK